MDVSLFANSPTGHLTPITVEERGRAHDHWAFVPDPLPSEFQLAPATWNAVVETAIAIGRLDALARALLPVPQLLARPAIRREAVSTSALEGTFAAAADVLTSEADEGYPRSIAITEVLNFVKTSEYGSRRIEDLPISTRLACELQGLLVVDTPSEDYQSGKIRNTQVIIGPYAGCSVREARYIPPPPGEPLLEGLSSWEKWIHAESDLPPIVKVAVAHYQFEALHPFTDGNGRIGRLLAILQLMANGLLNAPIINLSPYFEQSDEEYRHRLRAVSTEGDWDGWISFFCEALRFHALQAEAGIKALLEWKEATGQRLRASGVKGTALEVAAKLIESPVLTAKLVAKEHSVSAQAANNALARLVEFKVIEQSNAGNYNRVFIAQDVYKLIFEASAGTD